MSEEEKNNKEKLLKKISKELYNDEYFIETAITSYKAQQEKTYTFFKDNSTSNPLQKYNWCQRPDDTTMSLCNFTDNGVVHGWMSESLAEHYGLEQITLNDFIHHFVKPLIKENIEFKKRIDELENHIHYKKCDACSKEFKSKRSNARYCKECSKKINNKNYYLGLTEEQKAKRREQAKLSMRKLRKKQ